MADLSFDPATTRLDASLARDRIKEIVDTLFGHSEALDQRLVPALQKALASRPLRTYHDFIDVCDQEVQGWEYEQKGRFLYGHPEIGAPKVSGLSAKEQGSAQVDPKTLQRWVCGKERADERLQELNTEYRERYPGLLYLTFVNGRSREAIVEEMEAFLAGGE
jgi:2-oxo-4-hydroxy-4-carboxy--5-ureidoimidazoline (OHCU) decarboxylase